MTLPNVIGAWWLALPGTESDPSHNWPVIARRDSGRPWLLGDPGLAVLASAGPVHAAAVGDLLATEAEFAKSLLCATAHGDYDPMMNFPGNYQLVVCEPTRMLCFSDAAGLRRIYTAGYAGATIAGNRARLLATLSGTGIDPVWTAARMCAPAVPTPVRDVRSPYEHVTPTPAGCRVILTAGRTPRTARYWHPPSSELPLREGAAQLRRALETAVAGRARRSCPPVTVEFSGGLDSAALAAVAKAQIGADRTRLVTTPSTASGDLPWAHLVADHLGARHDVLDDTPQLFSGLPDAAPVATDDPSPAVGAARIARTCRAIDSAGRGLHFNGQGGDEVLGVPLAHLGPLLRARRCRGTVRRLRGYAALHATSTIGLARHALSEGSYRQWALAAAANLNTDVDPIRNAMSWEAHPRMMPWASAHARRLVMGALEEDVPTPWGDRNLHATLARIRASAAAASCYGQTMEELGGPVPAFPFFDKQVIEACLAVRPELRNDPWVFKPLLAAAMRDALPKELLARTTKGSYSPDVYRGWAHHQATIRALLRDPLLADLGLIEVEKFHHEMTGWSAAGLPPAYVTDLVAIELWARSAHTQTRRETAL